MIDGMQINLLLVDDEIQILSAMSRYFLACGYAVTCASTCTEAEAWLDKKPFDVVVTDLRLTDGVEAEGLRVVATARRSQPDALIVVLSAYGTTTLQIAATQAGANAFLSKPMSLAALDAVLRPHPRIGSSPQ